MRDQETIKNILEVLLFMTDRPLTEEQLKDIMELSPSEGVLLTESLQLLENDYNNRNSPLLLRHIAGGYQFANRPEYASWIRRLYHSRTTLRLSRSALETLAMIVYRQPLTRAEIEQIRGIDSSGVLETLLEHKLIRICGRKETLGHPLLYGTATEFLRRFGLQKIEDLPRIEEFEATTATKEDTSSGDKPSPAT